jgi:hypothetical protein
MSSEASSAEDEQSGQTAMDQKAVATAYVPQPQYERWQEKADERNQSVSSFIATMVELGLNEVKLEQESPSEIVELRQRLQKVRAERDDLQQSLQQQTQQDYSVGLGRIKEIIIENPGIERREIVNYVVSNPIQFVDKYLDELEESAFRVEEGQWYPPENLEDQQ